MDLKEDAFLLLFCAKQNNKFHVALCLKSNRPQKTSKYGKNISNNFFLFPTHFDMLCDILLNRCTQTWKLFANSVVTEVLSV